MRLKAYPKYKESGVDWIGKMPVGWEYRRVKHLTTNLDGKRIPITADLRIEGDIPYYGATGVVDHVQDYIFNETLLLVGEDGAPFFEQYKDVAYVIKGKSWVNNHAHVLRVIGKNNIAWLRYFMNSNDYTISIKGSTRDKLNQDDLKCIFVSMPPEGEQIQIAGFLNSKISQIEQTLEKDKKLIELLKEKRITLIYHTVTKGLDSNTKMKDSGVDWIGDIPEAWNINKLKYNSIVNPLRSKYFRDGKIEISFLPMESVDVNGGFDNQSKCNYGEVSSGYTNFHNGDILFAKITPCFENGKGAYVDNLINGVGFGTTEFHVLRSYNHIIPKYLFYFTKSHLFRFVGEANMRGTAGQKRITTDFTKDFPMPTPKVDEQKEIINILDREMSKIDKTINKIESKINFLEEYKKSLIHHVVTGKVDVRGVEI